MLARIGPVAYKLELPSYSKIHDVFHCSLLKPHVGPPPAESGQLPVDSLGNNPILTPLVILDKRIVIVNGSPQQQVLVQWTGLAPEEASWEAWQTMQEVYNLEDKVEFEGMGIDTDTTPSGGISNEQPTVLQPNTAEVRPTRTKRIPSKYNDHLLY